MIRKLPDSGWTRKQCRNREHNAPSMISLPPRAYVHTCPGCGAEQRIVIPQVRW